MAKRPANTAGPIAATIRNAGLRCTPARMAVLQHLAATRGPRTHAEVADSLSDRGFDRATIDRNLTELTAAHLVARVELGDHVWRFEIARPAKPGTKPGAKPDDHPHFVCTTCGDVSCLDDVEVSIAPRAAGGAAGGRRGRRGSPGIGAVREVLLKGTCTDCG
ncbi:MAG: Fur family transcriptional regulator [Planctomycetia bacterium]